jgi:4-amino-4-deoxy-L-arabinose transferase-like glycosyltransferase
LVFPAVIFVLLFGGLVALHISLLRLPYFWDEAGYYVPAARDLLLTGSLIPHSTPSNAHPPLVMAYLALSWKIAGYAPVVTRLAMLLVAAFSLLGLFRLARRVANTEVAVASTLCTALYPVFFAQSSLAQVDLAVAGLTFWALLAYVEDRRETMAVWFSLAVLAKETAILAPAALLLWEGIAAVLCSARACPERSRRVSPAVAGATRPRSSEEYSTKLSVRRSSLLLLPALPLTLWYGYHRLRTGFIFGNPEYFRYNVQATMHPLRILLALLMRLWQIVGYMNLYPLTLAALFAMWLPPLRDQGSDRTSDRTEQRPRIALSIQFVFLAVIATYVLAMAVIGGAVLARYMLPVVPLVIIVCVSTVWRRVRIWRGVVVITVLAFGAAWFINPPYGFSLEDNLAYRDYIELHQRAETFLEARYPMARVLTAWPASGELSQPTLGYVTRPMRVVQIEDFTVEELMSADELRSSFDVALVFSTKYEPRHPLLENWQAWERTKTEFFGYHRDVPPAAAAHLLGGRLVYTETRQRQWVGVIEMEQVQEARAGR